jgi:hypothetical protein
MKGWFCFLVLLCSAGVAPAAMPAGKPLAAALAAGPGGSRHPDHNLRRYHKAKHKKAMHTLLRIALGGFLVLAAGYGLARAFGSSAAGLPAWTASAFLIPFILTCLALLAIALLWLWWLLRLLGWQVKRWGWRRRFSRCYRF